MAKGNWEEVPRGDVQPQYADLFYVSINRKGDIAMSKRTWDRMGAPAGFKVLFDKVNSRIGLQPSSTLASKAVYPATKYNGNGARVVRGHRLLKEYRIEIPMTMRFYDADTDDDGILVLDLRTAKVPPRVKNHARNRGED